MTNKDFKYLAKGDLVKNKYIHKIFTVIANREGYVIALRTEEITSPDEWDIVSKARRVFK